MVRTASWIGIELFIKKMRSKDNGYAGNVAAVHEDPITVISEGTRNGYKIPNSILDAFDDEEVFLKLTIADLENYKV